MSDIEPPIKEPGLLRNPEMSCALNLMSPKSTASLPSKNLLFLVVTCTGSKCLKKLLTAAGGFGLERLGLGSRLVGFRFFGAWVQCAPPGMSEARNRRRIWELPGPKHLNLESCLWYPLLSLCLAQPAL